MSRKNSKSRIKKPFFFKTVYLYLLLVPAFNYYLVCERNEIPYEKFMEVLHASDPYTWVLVVPAPILIIFVSLLIKQGWYLLISYLIYSILMNSYLSIVDPSDYNIVSIAQAMYSMVILSYFLQKEIQKPFFKSGFKGWRDTERFEMNIPISVNGKSCKCINLSPGGCAVHWPNCPLAAQMTVSLNFKIRKKIFNIQGKIVRITASGEIGITFTGMEPATEKAVRELLIGVD